MLLGNGGEATELVWSTYRLLHRNISVVRFIPEYWEHLLHEMSSGIVFFQARVCLDLPPSLCWVNKTAPTLEGTPYTLSFGSVESSREDWHCNKCRFFLLLLLEYNMLNKLNPQPLDLKQTPQNTSRAHELKT